MGIPVLNDLSLADPPHVEGDDRRRAQAVVQTMRHYEILLAEYAHPRVAKARRQAAREVAQSLKPASAHD
jgi:hypothetical protein